jgi:Tfp pilus assembly protein PilP
MTRMRAVTPVLALLIGVTGLPVALVARGTAQPPTAPESVPAVTEPEPVPAVAETVEQPEFYAYDSEGRRDPFVSLLARGTDLPSDRERPDGLVGLSVNEVALRGVVLSEGAYFAVLEAPDNRTYIVRADDRLFDGSVKEITADGIVFLQEVNDPLALVSVREVRKGLQDAEEGR